MKRRLILAAGMSALLLATLLPAQTSAARDPERFGRVDRRGRVAHLGRLPSMQRRNQLVDVAVEVQGRTVSSWQAVANASGQTLTNARKDAIRRGLDVRQDAVAARLRANGARVTGRYTDVFNGLRVRVRAGRVDRLARLDGVKAIYPILKHRRATANTDRYLGAPATWGQTGFTGQGVKIAVIDSGINYYHRDFAGSGFAAWSADDGLIREPGTFPTTKVVAGWDLVGDDYDGESNPVANPDPDPLDCKAADAGTVQHGTHVSGIAAGTGVRANGQTYNGAYNANTLDNVDFRIAPGVAPQAKLMAFRVFGCDGSTTYVVDALEMAVRAGADVINMSLGSDFGNPASLDAIATNNAVLAGVVVVSSAGNSGPSSYVTGSPAVATRSISVAAMDAQPGFPGATVNMATGSNIDAINANGAALPASGAVNYFEDDPSTSTDADTGEGDESLGCFAADYTYNSFSAGQIAVTHRGICARIDRAKRGQEHDAAAVIMVNNSSGLPPYEYNIGGVTIPFVGVSGDDDGRFATDDGASITIKSAGDIDNPAYQHTADFTSSGPSRFVNQIKPDIAAPGVSVFSADGSTVAQGKSLSGTSMASPAVAGVAALVLEAHPNWQPRAIKAAIVGTGAPNRLVPYVQILGGVGVARPLRAVDAVGYALTEPGSSSITFGYQQAGNQPGTQQSFNQARTIELVNTSNHAITYHLSNVPNGPLQGLNVSLSTNTVTVPAHDRRTIVVRATMNQPAAGALPDSAPFHGPVLGVDDFGQLYLPLNTVAGSIVADPTGSGAGVYPIRIPWVVVPRGLSRIQDVPGSRTDYTLAGGVASASVKVRNYGVHRGWADVYAWGLMDGEDGFDGIDLRAAGVQSIDPAVCDSGADASDRCLIFAVNIWNRWGNPSENEIDILIDVDGDGTDDYAVVGVDLGLVLGIYQGVIASAIIDLHTDELANLYLASASTNGSTILLPVLASDLGLDAKGDQNLEYWAASFDVYDVDGFLEDFHDEMGTGLIGEDTSYVAKFNAFSPTINNGTFKVVGPGAVKSIPLSVDTATYQPKRGHRGWLIVSLDDENGFFQADFVPVGQLP